MSGSRHQRRSLLSDQVSTDGASLVELLNVLLRHRVLIVLAAIALALIWSVPALTRPRTYTSVASFMPQQRRSQSGLSGIASQLGLSIGGQEGGISSQFYVDLIEYRQLLRSVVESQYQFRSENGSTKVGTLIDYFGLTDPVPERRREAAITQLRSQLSVNANPKTGVITVRAKTVQAALSAQIATRILEAVNDFNLRSRQSEAGSERKFTEKRLAEAQIALREAENRLEYFLQVNRDIRAPQLQLQKDRLDREISTRQQVYTSLAQAYEQAKIEEVRDTPLITPVETPEVPVFPDGRGVILKFVLGLALGGMFGVVLAFARDYLQRSGHRGGDTFAEFSALRKAALEDLLHPWKPLKRIVRKQRRKV